VADPCQRNEWLASQILPYEQFLRTTIRKWRLPEGLDLDDIVQQAYARLASLPSVDHIRSPRSYFLQTARTLVLMHIRRARLVPIEIFADLSGLELADDSPSPETEISDREQLRLLAQAIDQLGEPGRTVFLARVREGKSHKEIGALVGLSDNAVQKLLARTMQALARKISRGGSLPTRASIARDTRRNHGPL